MALWQAIILGLVQGLTEFIPVSSSGHLLLLQQAFGITEAGLAFDVALHIGTLAALLVYFYQDILDLAKSVFGKGPNTRLAWFIAAATVPAAIIGYLLQDTAETTFRSPYLVTVNLAIVAVIMLVAEGVAARRQGLKQIEKISLGQAMFVGLAQALALVPGVSRSGATITGGLFAGLDRLAATRFSFILAIPITIGAVIKVVADSDTMSKIGDRPDLFAVGIITAFLSGAFAIRFLLKFVAKHSLASFAYYRLALAALSLLLLTLF